MIHANINIINSVQLTSVFLVDQLLLKEDEENGNGESEG